MFCFCPWEDSKQTNENEVNNLGPLNYDTVETLEECYTKDNCVDMEKDSKKAIINESSNVEDNDLFHFKENSKFY